MSARRPRRKRNVMAQMNVVPYIDVMLVLLVIFMVTAPMMQSGVNVDLPNAEAQSLTADNQREPLIVSITADGALTLQDETPVTASQLVDTVRLSQIEGERPVYVRADKRVPYEHIMTAMSAIQRGGAKAIGMMAEPLNR